MDYKEKVIALLSNQELSKEQKEKLENIFPELKESKDERITREILELVSVAGNGNQFEEIQDWLEKQSKKKSADEVLKIRQELYQSGYNDGYKHGQKDLTVSFKKESIEALEHFVRGIGESGYACPYDNRTKLIYGLLEQLKQIVNNEL